MKKLFQSTNEFSQYIEQRAIDNGITCCAALLEYCEEADVDPDEIAKSVSKQLKEKLAIDFAALGMLKTYASLD